MCLAVWDVGGRAVLHALANKGETEILAVMFNEVHPDGAAAIDAFNTWYGRGDIPVGAYRGPFPDPATSGFLHDLITFPHDLTSKNVTCPYPFTPHTVLVNRASVLAPIYVPVIMLG